MPKVDIKVNLEALDKNLPMLISAMLLRLEEDARELSRTLTIADLERLSPQERFDMLLALGEARIWTNKIKQDVENWREEHGQPSAQELKLFRKLARTYSAAEGEE